MTCTWQWLCGDTTYIIFKSKCMLYSCKYGNKCVLLLYCQKWQELPPHPILWDGDRKGKKKNLRKKYSPQNSCLWASELIPTVEDHLPSSRTSWVWVNMGLNWGIGGVLISLTSQCWEWTPFDCKLIINHECDLHKSSYTDDWHWWYI